MLPDQTYTVYGGGGLLYAPKVLYSEGSMFRKLFDNNSIRIPELARQL